MKGDFHTRFCENLKVKLFWMTRLVVILKTDEMIGNDFEYKIIKPDLSLSNFVERFWMLSNHSENDKEIVVIPVGRIDILFSYSAKQPFHVILLDLERI